MTDRHPPPSIISPGSTILTFLSQFSFFSPNKSFTLTLLMLIFPAITAQIRASVPRGFASKVNYPSRSLSTLAFASNGRNKIDRYDQKQQRISNYRSMPTILRASSSKAEVTSGVNEGQKALVSDMLYRIRECNAPLPRNVMEFCVDGKILGKVTPKMAELLSSYSNKETQSPVFQLTTKEGDKSISTSSSLKILTLAVEAGTTCESRTDAVMSVMEQLRDDGFIAGWRDELYPIAEGFYDEPSLLIERAAAPFVGGLEYGVHISGLVTVPGNENGEDATTKMWMARRSKTKSKYPGMLDHIVAGGQPANMGLMENVIKECMEEAGIPEHLVRKGVRPAGGISYETYVVLKNSRQSKKDDQMGVISRCVLFSYDLTLPDDFVPKVVDGEVDHFFLWAMDEVMECMRKGYNDPMKPNCYPVVIDYLMREGYVSPETPGYLDVLRELRSGFCC